MFLCMDPIKGSIMMMVLHAEVLLAYFQDRTCLTHLSFLHRPSTLRPFPTCLHRSSEATSCKGRTVIESPEMSANSACERGGREKKRGYEEESICLGSFFEFSLVSYEAL